MVVWLCLWDTAQLPVILLTDGTVLYLILIHTYTFGVRFRKGFDAGMLARQAGMDRYAHNKLLETLREEYRRTGRVNTTRGRVNAWYTDLRNAAGPRWLRQSVSQVTRQTLYDLARHYKQYADTDRARAAGITPETEWGEPHFKRHGERISVPLTITHDGTAGSARFVGGRILRVAKMGDIALSRPFPVNNYRPKAARLLQTADGRWRMTVSCQVPDGHPEVTGSAIILGVDRNVGNMATAGHMVEPPSKMVRRMANAERTAARAQRIMARRRKPDGRLRRPGSRRWAKAARRAAKNRRRGADIRRTITHKMSRVIADSCTHVALEKLSIPNMTKSAKGTIKEPGTNVKQKSGLNRSILGQCWGLLALLLAYKLAGGIIWVSAAYTSQRCCPCGFVDKDNRDGRKFLCRRCGHSDHADCNAGSNIEKAGLEKLGPGAVRGQLKLRHDDPILPALPADAGSAHVKGRLDAEGSCIGSPLKRQAPTGGRDAARTVVLWRDV